MIYYVEDDTNVRDLALYALKHAGLETRGFDSAEPFRQALQEQLPDLVLLDIMLPGTDGLELLEELRADGRTAHLPVMMLTAKGTEYDKVLGLDAGADDYLAKPFGMMELVSRCKALLRRAGRGTAAAAGSAGAAEESAELLRCGVVELDLAAHEARCDGVSLDLTLKEFDLLAKLLREQGHALTRAQLLEDVWDISYVGETRTVDTHVQTLRRKLNAASSGAGNLVQTIRGVGYRIKDGS
ncbi:MAG: response regulator transcription factor [Coriobacteriia bacterium]|nr:response regulator transcription factor [Coriobacteriia bacterium]